MCEVVQIALVNLKFVVKENDKMKIRMGLTVALIVAASSVSFAQKSGSGAGELQKMITETLSGMMIINGTEDSAHSNVYESVVFNGCTLKWTYRVVFSGRKVGFRVLYDMNLADLKSTEVSKLTGGANAVWITTDKDVTETTSFDSGKLKEAKLRESSMLMPNEETADKVSTALDRLASSCRK